MKQLMSSPFEAPAEVPSRAQVWNQYRKLGPADLRAFYLHAMDLLSILNAICAEDADNATTAATARRKRRDRYARQAWALRTLIGYRLQMDSPLADVPAWDKIARGSDVLTEEHSAVIDALCSLLKELEHDRAPIINSGEIFERLFNRQPFGYDSARSMQSAVRRMLGDRWPGPGRGRTNRMEDWFAFCREWQTNDLNIE